MAEKLWFVGKFAFYFYFGLLLLSILLNIISKKTESGFFFTLGGIAGIFFIAYTISVILLHYSERTTHNLTLVAETTLKANGYVEPTLTKAPVIKGAALPYLNDPDHLLNVSQQNGIKRHLLEISSLPNGIQIGVVLQKKNTTNQPIEEISRDILKKEQIGALNKGRGMLFYLVQDDNTFRIEESKELEGEFTDGYLGMISRTFITPSFEKKQYYFPLTNLLNSINNTLQTGNKTFTEESIRQSAAAPASHATIEETTFWSGLGLWQKILIVVLGVPVVVLGAGVTIRVVV
jgi:uncharacterized membrane protein YgcG